LKPCFEQRTIPADSTSRNAAGRGNMKVLYSAGELRDAIQEVLATPDPGDRRVVAVAFVGGHAEAFLPEPRDLEIVCWLQAASTDALTLERLRGRGAKIFKSERLHMKVYWSSTRGCVVCSANASGQALGGGDQKEAGVWLPPGAVDIERLLEEARPEPVKPSDLKRLRRQGDRTVRDGAGGAPASTPDFLEWRSLSGRRDWKLGAWEYDAKLAKESVKIATKPYGVTEPYDFLDNANGQIKPFDWQLTFRLPKVENVGWLHVDFVVEVPRSDTGAYIKGYTFQVVQVHAPNMYRPPFKIDRAFVTFLRKAVGNYGVDKLEALDSLAPPNELLDMIGAELDAIQARTQTQGRQIAYQGKKVKTGVSL
jgi:hypothetical protein